MKASKKSNFGFSVVELLIVMVLIGVVCGVGYYVLQGKQSKNDSKAGTANNSTEDKSATISTSQNPNFVNVIQENNTVSQVTPEKIAKTPDQVSILTALYLSCAGEPSTQVTVNYVVFNGDTNFKQSAEHAVINAGVCGPKGSTLDEVGGSSANSYLHKNFAGFWVLDDSSQDAPNCAKIDRLAYPATIVDSCNDGATLRQPRQ